MSKSTYEEIREEFYKQHQHLRRSSNTWECYNHGQYEDDDYDDDDADCCCD